MNKKILFIVVSNILISGVYAQQQQAVATSSKQFVEKTAVGYQSLNHANKLIKAATTKPQISIDYTSTKAAAKPAKKSQDVALTTVADGDTQVASNAVNFSKNIGVNVNERTGQASLNINILQLPGVSQSTGISLAINKSDQDNNTYFNLNDDWQWNLDYLHTDAAGNTQLHLAQGGQYQYDNDHNYLSGMRYYQLNDARLRASMGSVVLNDLKDKPTISYSWIFQALDGTVKYFSRLGLLLAQQDRYGNSIAYSYDCSQGGTPYKARLVGVENAYSAVKLTYQNGQQQTITIAAPADRSYVLNIGNTLTRLSYPALADKSVLHTDINTTYNDSDKSKVMISYPDGSAKEIFYTKIPYMIGQNMISAVDSVRDYASVDQDSYIESQYIYHGNNDDTNNFSGYPQIQSAPLSCLQNPSGDILLSCDVGGSRALASFTYTTQVVQSSVKDGVSQPISKTVNTYNSLHLQTTQTKLIPAASTSGWLAVSEDSDNYKDAGTELVRQLPVDYQLPSKKISASCDPANSSCKLDQADPVNSENALLSMQALSYTQNSNNYSTQPTSVTSAVMINGQWQDQTKETTQYDLADDKAFSGHYGLTQSQVLAACTDDDCDALGQTFSTQNTLSADGKYIQTSVLTGSNGKSDVTLAATNADNNMSRITTTTQDDKGRITKQTLSQSSPTAMMSLLAVNGTGQSNQSVVTTDYMPSGNEITIKETKNDDGTVTKVVDIRNGNVMQETDAQGHKTIYTYDALGRVLTENVPDHGTISYFYQVAQQPNQLPASFIDPGASDINAQIKREANGLEHFKISYMLNGQQVSKEGDNYNPQNDTLTQNKDNPFADLVRITSVTYSNLQGQKLKSIDINNNVTSYVYDSANRQVEVDNPDGTKSITAYYGDGNGGLKIEFSMARNAENAKNAQDSQDAYDISNVNVTQTNSKSQQIASYSFSNEIFDKAKDKLDSGSYVASDYGDMSLVNEDVLAAIASKAHLLTTDSSVYDNFGNLTQSTDNNGVVTTYDYDDIIYTTEDDNGQKTTHYGHMIASHSSYPSDVVNDKTLQSVSKYTMSYAYDMFDNTTAKSLSYDDSTPYELGARQYDVNDNLIQESGNGITISRKYDDNGNVIEKVLPYGAAGSSEHAVICNSYDDVNNLIESDVYVNTASCDSKDPANLEQTLTWQYDSTTQELMSATKSYGAAAKIKHDPTTISYSYYKDGSLKTKTYPDGKTLSYVYNDNGSVKTITDPFGMVTALSYDAMGKKIVSEKFTKAGNTTEVDFKYNNWGQLIERDSGNIKQTSTFNDLGLLTQINNYFKGGLVNQFSFSYYNDGNLKQKTREDHINGNVGKSVENYVYDAMNNLQSYSCQNDAASIGGNVNLCPRDQYGNIIKSQSYTFDPFNNIKQEKSQFMPS
ncbi:MULTISPECIES: RHS repeat domain-containing protein [Cysteiniphilum]|uniref:RHS repeat domain-containing protein n=1 Tax=Cysteiniphilum TaxID=2056696 RepID=UPI001781D0F4|nr:MULTISPECIES: RHS repeat domain-containing protein [Cysteiniphilum]